MSGKFYHCINFFYLPACYSAITTMMPPSMAIVANTSLRVMGSPRKATPPIEVITGTLSFVVTAWVNFNAVNAVYQIMQPIPEVSAPSTLDSL